MELTQEILYRSTCDEETETYWVYSNPWVTEYHIGNIVVKYVPDTESIFYDDKRITTVEELQQILDSLNINKKII